MNSIPARCRQALLSRQLQALGLREAELHYVQHLPCPALQAGSFERHFGGTWT